MHNMGKKGGWGMLMWVLLVVGAINWGLVGLGGYAGQNWNVVNLIFGSVPSLEWIIYILVGIAGLSLLFGWGHKR